MIIWNEVFSKFGSFLHRIARELTIRNRWRFLYVDDNRSDSEEVMRDQRLQRRQTGDFKVRVWSEIQIGELAGSAKYTSHFATITLRSRRWSAMDDGELQFTTRRIVLGLLTSRFLSSLGLTGLISLLHSLLAARHPRCVRLIGATPVVCSAASSSRAIIARETFRIVFSRTTRLSRFFLPRACTVRFYRARLYSEKSGLKGALEGAVSENKRDFPCSSEVNDRESPATASVS